ncbi:MAG: ABC transporter ATP-binding protein, partial [Halobacteriales archaeon]
ARGVTKEYDDLRAVDHVTLTVGSDGLHCLVGPNGSGKTTLFRLLAGLTNPTEGSVRRPTEAMGIGFQHPTFYRRFTVAENLEVFADLVGADADWRATLVEQFDLAPVVDRQAAALSGGQANKLDLALAMLGRPEILLVDEPLGDLDDVSRERVVRFLDEYAAGSRTVLVATHRLGAFEGALDRLTVFRRGQVLFDAAGDRLDAALEPDGAHAHYLDLLSGENGTPD